MPSTLSPPPIRRSLPIPTDKATLLPFAAFSVPPRSLTIAVLAQPRYSSHQRSHWGLSSRWPSRWCHRFDDGDGIWPY